MESRLIDANSVISVLQNIKNSLDGAPANPVDMRAVILTVVDIIKEQPTVDAVPVVRCRDCKSANIRDDMGEDFYECPQNGVTVFCNGEHFCGYGTPRTQPLEPTEEN